MGKENMVRFKVGDLVFYKPTHGNRYADGSKQLGVVIEVLKDQTPLILSCPEKEYFEFEYRVKWIDSGHISTLLGFNLKKLEIVDKKT